MVAGCIGQVVALYSNNFMEISLGRLSTGRLIEVVVWTGLTVDATREQKKKKSIYASGKQFNQTFNNYVLHKNKKRKNINPKDFLWKAKQEFPCKSWKVFSREYYNMGYKILSFPFELVFLNGTDTFWQKNILYRTTFITQSKHMMLWYNKKILKTYDLL